MHISFQQSSDFNNNKSSFNQSINQSIIFYIYSNFKTQETNLQLQKDSKLQLKILVEKTVIKHV